MNLFCVRQKKCSVFINKYNGVASINITKASILLNLLHLGNLFDDFRDFIKFHLF